MTRPQQRAFDDWRKPVSPITEIIRLVSFRHGYTAKQILEYGRTQDLARTRQVAMHLAARTTSFPSTVIGRRFRRDPTTILHAVKRVEWLRRCDAEFAADLAVLENMLGVGGE